MLCIVSLSSVGPGKAGVGLSPWLRGEIPSQRKEQSKVTRQVYLAAQTPGRVPQSVCTIKELALECANYKGKR